MSRFIIGIGMLCVLSVLYWKNVLWVVSVCSRFVVLGLLIGLNVRCVLMLFVSFVICCGRLVGLLMIMCCVLVLSSVWCFDLLCVSVIGIVLIWFVIWIVVCLMLFDVVLISIVLLCLSLLSLVSVL